MAAGLVLLLLLIGSLAARPDWHAAFHSGDTAGHGSLESALHQSCDPGPADSHPGGSDEGCAIKLYASGGINLAETPPTIPLPEPELNQVLVSPSRTPAVASSLREPPGRAPPSLIIS